jgi:hypothetical protein
MERGKDRVVRCRGPRERFGSRELHSMMMAVSWMDAPRPCLAVAMASDVVGNTRAEDATRDKPWKDEDA